MSDVAGADLSPDAVRAEVAQWIENNWDPELPLARWRELLAGSGWALGRPPFSGQLNWR